MLAVLDPESLVEHITRRGREVGGRRAERYLENFDSIWRLQSYLLSEADRWGIPIIPNTHQDQVIGDIMKTVVDHLSVDFNARPKDVFS